MLNRTRRTTSRISTSSSKRIRSKPSMINSMLDNLRTKISIRGRRIRTADNSRSSSSGRIEVANRNSAFSKCRTRTRSNGRLNSSRIGRMRAGSNNEISNGSMRTGSSTMPNGIRVLIVIRTSSAFGRAPGKTIVPETGGQITAVGSSAADTAATGFPRTAIAATSAHSIGFGSPAAPSWCMADIRASSTRVTG